MTRHTTRRSVVAALAATLSGCASTSTQLGGDSRQSGSNTSSTSTTPGTATATETGTATSSETPPSTQRPTETPVAIRPAVDVEREQFDLSRVSFEERPQFIYDRRNAPVCRYDAADVGDIENVKTATIDGETGQMPIRTFRTMMRLTYCYRASGTDTYLEKARAIAAAALDAATTVDGVPYFPYTMAKSGSSADLEPPWYSGMAQGVALSAFVRLYEQTGAERYRRTADAVAESFARVQRSTDGPWVTMVDDGYYWIEEYPADPPTHVLNGFLVGLWGLYEYWLVFESTGARRLVEAALTTMRAHLSEYREPGEVSWYGLDQERGYRGNETYHAVHIHQIGVLARLTDDPYFERMERLFESDNPESEGVETAG